MRTVYVVGYENDNGWVQKADLDKDDADALHRHYLFMMERYGEIKRVFRFDITGEPENSVITYKDGMVIE